MIVNEENVSYILIKTTTTTTHNTSLVFTLKLNAMYGKTIQEFQAKMYYIFIRNVLNLIPSIFKSTLHISFVNKQLLRKISVDLTFSVQC